MDCNLVLKDLLLRWFGGPARRVLDDPESLLDQEIRAAEDHYVQVRVANYRVRTAARSADERLAAAQAAGEEWDRLGSLRVAREAAHEELRLSEIETLAAAKDLEHLERRRGDLRQAKQVQRAREHLNLGP